MSHLEKLNDYNTIAILNKGDFNYDDKKFLRTVERIKKFIEEETKDEEIYLEDLKLPDYSSIHVRVKNGFTRSFLITAIITQEING